MWFFHDVLENRLTLSSVSELGIQDDRNPVKKENWHHFAIV